MKRIKYYISVKLLKCNVFGEQVGKAYLDNYKCERCMKRKNKILYEKKYRIFYT
jgi:hypothetical protein